MSPGTAANDSPALVTDWSPLVWAAGRELDPPVTGSSGDGWHAVVRAYAPRVGEGQVCGEAACGATVTVAAKYGPFDPDRFPARTCALCLWTVALRDGSLVERYRRLAEAEGTPGLAARVAEAIVAAQSQHDAGYELDDPASVQLLAAVTAHAPTLLIDEDCAEGGCGHPRYEPCPTVAMVCLTCSQLAGSWAGEREGAVMHECTISAPCEVLSTLAAHFQVTGGAW